MGRWAQAQRAGSPHGDVGRAGWVGPEWFTYTGKWGYRWTRPVPPLFWEVVINRTSAPTKYPTLYLYISGEETQVGTGYTVDIALEAKIRAQWADGWGPWSPMLPTP